MLLDVCKYVLCMYGSSLWVYTRPRAGLNSIGLEVSLRLKSVLPQAGVTATHIKSSFFSISFSSIFKCCPTQILWEVNFLFVNVVRGRADWVVSRRMWSLWKFANIFKLLLNWIHLEMMQLWWPELSFPKKVFIDDVWYFADFCKISSILQNIYCWCCLLHVNNSCDSLSKTAHFWFCEATAAYLEGEPGQVGL